MVASFALSSTSKEIAHELDSFLEELEEELSSNRLSY